MKKIISVILILICAQFVCAQTAPLSQAEYVKMLYALQKNPAGKADVIDQIRKRGIGFELNDGLRGLTRSKGGNDEELKRTLEEAERRRASPATAAKLPTAKESGGSFGKNAQKHARSRRRNARFRRQTANSTVSRLRRHE